MTRILTEERIKRPILAHLVRGEHISSFLDGKLSLAHFTDFRKTDTDGSGRYDPDEGFMSIGNPGNTRVFIGQEKAPGQAVPIEQCRELSSLVGKIKMQVSDDEYCHILCFTTFCMNEVEQRIDLRLAKDKDYVVIFRHVKEFLARFDQAVIDANLGGHRDYVEYIDDNEIRKKPIFFAKPLEFSYQSEIRFAVYGQPGKERLLLDIGDIRSLVAVQDLKTGEIVDHNAILK